MLVGVRDVLRFESVNGNHEDRISPRRPGTRNKQERSDTRKPGKARMFIMRLLHSLPLRWASTLDENDGAAANRTSHSFGLKEHDRQA